MILRWPGKVPAGKVENGIVSGMDWFPTFVAAAGNPNITTELLKGKQLGDKTYKVHLDGYNQMDLHHRQGSVESPRDLLLREGSSARCGSTITSIGSPTSRGWLGGKIELDWPYPDQSSPRPFRAHRLAGNMATNGSLQYFDWFKYEFWRFVFVQQQVAKLAHTAIEFPPMQTGASFNLEAVKAQIEAARAAMAK